MKIVKFLLDGRCSSGVVQGDELAVISSWHNGSACQAPFEVVRLTPVERVKQLASSRERVSLADVALLAPLDCASKIICVGANYRDHATEIGMMADGPPQTFIKFSDALVGHGQPIMRPAISAQFDFEGELAVVIGRAGRYLRPENAMEHVLGYSCFMDGSVRDFQKHSIAAGKNFRHSGSMGPWLVTADEFQALPGMRLRTLLNGKEVQSTTLGMMVHGIADLIAYCSQWTALAPGDVIATGTPAGIGSRRNPPLWMVPADVVEVSIDGIGTLRNFVIGEQAH